MSGRIRTIVAVIFILGNYQIKALAQNITNYSFENWTYNANGMPEPENWETQNEAELVFVESSEGHTGSYSACLNIVWDNMMQKFTGANMSYENNINGDKAFKSLTGFCKGNINNTDTLNISVNVYSKNKLVGYGTCGILYTNNSWEEFQVSINYYSDEKPEKTKISFSVNLISGSHYQTTYCIDDLKFN